MKKKKANPVQGAKGGDGTAKEEAAAAVCRKEGGEAEKQPKAQAEPAEQPESPANPEQPEIVEAQSETAQTPEQPETAEPAEAAECSEMAEQIPLEENQSEPELNEEPDEDLDEESSLPPLTPEQQAEEERRRADITRTVQVSIEQIMEAASQDSAEMPNSTQAEQDEPSDDSEETEEKITSGNALRRAAAQLLRWLLLVAAIVAVIAGAGFYWLYQQATPDMIPAITVTFDGHPVQPASYHWRVPVAGNRIKRTYKDTVNAKPVALGQTVEKAGPELSVTPSDLRTELTVKDAEGQTLFEGTAQQFRAYRFEQNGDYTARLVVSNAQTYAGEAAVTGSQTYDLTFTVNIRPTVRLNTQSVSQGGVAALIVSGVQDDTEPQLTTQLPATEFYQGTRNWVAYLPIAVDTEPQDYTIRVQTGDYTQSLTLKVRARTESYRDYTSKSQLTKPYVGPEDTPQEVLDLLDKTEETLHWTDTGFSSPFTKSMTVALPYGTTEYLNRTRAEKTKGQGSGRTSINAVLSGSCDLVAPAAGRVLLARDLKGTGNTLVIEHGAGVKTIFYGLKSLSVKEGTLLTRGEKIAVTGKSTIAEVRIGQTPVEPLAVLRGQCDALKNY
ncbi:MAG: M23 family metallopeptidase [Oscillospiraceae bacterium]|nr:M23 family metallopeptidase [Oscillospiraceae bacterium]